MNIVGFQTLYKKEVYRFKKVALQTVLAPVISALLYQLIFSHVMQGRPDILPGVNYTAFLIPGLAMMSMLQNSFANSSSSLIQSKVSGSLVFVLLPPIEAFSFFMAYVAASVTRGIVVGLGVILVTFWFGLPMPVSLIWIFVFAILSCAIMGTLGVLAGVIAEKFDQMAMFQNFIIMPLTFLSGVFYSINTLPDFWRQVSYFNPMFYMIDGFRYGFFGESDVAPMLSFTVVFATWAILSLAVVLLIKSGWKLRT